MTFDKFNIEYASNCKKKDYLFVGSLAKYTSVSENILMRIQKMKIFLVTEKYFEKPTFCVGLALRKLHPKQLQADLEEEDDDGEVPLEQERHQGRLQSQSNRYFKLTIYYFLPFFFFQQK